MPKLIADPPHWIGGLFPMGFRQMRSKRLASAALLACAQGLVHAPVASVARKTRSSRTSLNGIDVNAWDYTYQNQDPGTASPIHAVAAASMQPPASRDDPEQQANTSQLTIRALATSSTRLVVTRHNS